MKCPQCQFENPDGNKYCGDCGTRIENSCPKCNYIKFPQFKFCGSCGHKLEEPPPKKSQSLHQKASASTPPFFSLICPVTRPASACRSPIARIESSTASVQRNISIKPKKCSKKWASSENWSNWSISLQDVIKKHCNKW